MRPARRLAAAVAVAAVVGLALLYLASRPRDDSASVAPAEGSALVSSEARPPSPDAVQSTTDESADDQSEGATANPDIESASAPLVDPAEHLESPTVVASAPKPDLEARDWIEIRVVDPDQIPVADAELRIFGLRRDGDSGSWYPHREDEPTATSDAQGHARLSYWTWVDELGRSRAVDLIVRHPDFVPYRDDSLDIGTGEHVIVLQRGGVVAVSGWIGSRDVVVTDVSVQCDTHAMVRRSEWTRGRDGRLSTSQLAPGPHLIRLEHTSDVHGLCFSDVAEFVLEESERKELQLDLHPAEDFEGVLDPIVPRPIVDGHVRVGLAQGGRQANEPSIYREFDADVRADGSFIVERLPPGRGQIFVLCRGWVSKRTLADSALDAGVHVGGLGPPTPEAVAEALERMGDRAFQWQRVRVPQPVRPFVVLMEPTGTIEITVQLADGSPVARAIAGINPNVCFIGVGCSIAPWRQWFGTADGTGLVWIEDVPPQELIHVLARHDDYEHSPTLRGRGVPITVRSGETTRVALTLERKRE